MYIDWEEPKLNKQLNHLATLLSLKKRLNFCLRCGRFSLFTDEEVNLFIHETCPVLH